MSKSATFRKQLRLLTDVVDYMIWLESRHKGVKIENNREAVWRKMANHLSSHGKQAVTVELGVAWGYTTWWWFTKQSRTIKQWDGFDRFTGLPTIWRSLPAGTFDAGGEPPQIFDERIVWHVGDVEQTLLDFEFPKMRKESSAKVIFFDLDLFEPSLFSWEYLSKFLKPGDLLYFDEAYDHDERRLLEENVFPFGNFRFIASSLMSLAIEVEEIFGNVDSL